ncbi:adenosylcobinamide-phosphate synthase CbiB [Natranaerobius trueperi]|uniref:Cobalamin biosynthesis protein CobD n=1 Tax=Natranaerobius trueperi TaxID=759412 RepID=A0A226BV99_9FIRM|nr:adenosylcobinamide-phosphate synthase CbiB [Natranaerobius trueperi]OWZ82968.1 cobalamin biosynthesis protein CobD [Natranaerobius trueperi]
MELALIISIAFILDVFFGDFWGKVHPICLIGNMITFLQRQSNKVFHIFKSPTIEIVIGGIIAFITILLTTYISLLLASFHLVFELLIINSAIAYKGLIVHLQKVYLPLKQGDITRARQALSQIVGRDVDNLNKSEITRGGVETGAESISDGIIAPLFYAVIGGAPLVMTYKAVNTLDSMIGYPFEPYKNIGYVSAKLDDLLNFIPARMTTLFMLVAGWVLNLNVRLGYLYFRKDANKHPSPNAGCSEATISGLLNVRLGGTNTYQGQPSFRTYLHKDGNLPKVEDISSTINIIKITSWIGLIVFICLRVYLRWLF